MKKRGGAQAELAGHTTEYTSTSCRCPWRLQGPRGRRHAEEVFRLLTDVRYFNQILSWQERRKRLFELCGEPSDDEIYRARPELAQLREAANGISIADFKIVLQKKLAALRDTLKMLPQRLDEAQRTLTPPVDMETVNRQKAEQEARLEEYNGLLNASSNARRAELESDCAAWTQTPVRWTPRTAGSGCALRNEF